jgi:peptidoglycan/xylan/chitin deacetylase (PgdA/CDA1 family)
MRSRLKRYKQILILLLALLGVVIFFYFKERKQVVYLQSLIQKQENIVAPYYEKDVFTIPTDLNKNSKVEKIKIPMIMYHYVEYVKDDGDLIRRQLNIVPSLFEGHLQALRKANYETYFVRDVPAILSDSVRYSTQSAILTFDDGYEDFYTVVFPLLKKYHMRATVYIIYDYIGRTGFLNEKQIQELAESDLVEIGSHTLDHVYLKQAPDLYAEKQIIESKKLFEDRFHIKIKTFAYPYGAFNAKNIESVKKAGYTAAVSVISGVMQDKDNLFYLSRIRPGLFTPSSMIRVIEQMKN